MVGRKRANRAANEPDIVPVVVAEDPSRGFFASLFRLLVLLGVGYALWRLWMDEERRDALLADNSPLAPARDHVRRAMAEGKRAAARRRAELEAAAGLALSPVDEEPAPWLRAGRRDGSQDLAPPTNRGSVTRSRDRYGNSTERDPDEIV